MPVTLSDIATKAGVDKSTVSIVINRKPKGLRVAKQTRDRIMKIARNLDYRPSLMARSLVQGKTMTLGLVCGDIHTPYFAEFASVALRMAEEKGYHLLISVTEWDEKKELYCLDMLMQRQADGIMMYCGSLKPETRLYKTIRASRFPVVVLGASIEGFSHVLTDYRHGMTEAVKILKENGHERVAFVSQSGTNRSRKAMAFCQACEKLDVTPVEYSCDLDMPKVVKMGHELALDQQAPKALIAFSDYTAIGLIQGIRQTGQDVPNDFEIIGIDGTEWGRYFHPSLTTITRDIKTIASRAINQLVGMIDAPTGKTREVFVSSVLTVRGSTRTKN